MYRILPIFFICLLDAVSSLSIQRRSPPKNPTGEGRLVNRRQILQSSALLLPTIPSSSSAALFDSSERRQLEVCLVAIMRVVLWAQSLERPLGPQTYLQCRLGAKAILTGKIGGGSTERVVSLANLQVKSCLNDLQYYAENPRRYDDLRQDWVESIAGLVEFDGLDNLIDPSPRSSLALAQYTDKKAKFCQRLVDEKIIPVGNQLVQLFPATAISTSQRYISQYYPDELLQ